MKILTLLSAVCLLGLASCGHKICPAYSNVEKQNDATFAKEVVKSSTSRI